jgi:hypothetical protein
MKKKFKQDQSQNGTAKNNVIAFNLQLCTVYIAAKFSFH